MEGGRRPSVKDDLWWKMTSGGRRPLVEDDLWWKTTFGGSRLFWRENYSMDACGSVDQAPNLFFKIHHPHVLKCLNKTNTYNTIF